MAWFARMSATAPLATKLYGLLAVMALVFTAQQGLFLLPEVKRQLFGKRQDANQYVVQVASGVVAHFGEQERSGRLSGRRPRSGPSRFCRGSATKVPTISGSTTCGR